MGLEDLHDKINTANQALVRIETKFDTTLPHLATKEHVTKCLSGHESRYHKIRASLNGSAAKIGTIIGTALALIGSTVFVLLKVFG